MSAPPPLKVLILNQSFWPDVVATAQHAHDLARFLVRQGAEVTVVASRSRYGQLGGSLPDREIVDGIDVHRVSSNRFRKSSFALRAVDYALFNVACLVKALMLPRHDVIICLTTPPFIGLVGAIVRRFKGGSLVHWTMDLYPDLPLAAGVIRRDSRTFRFFDRIDGWALRQAEAIVALGRCMKERIISKGIDIDCVQTISPWSDPVEVGFSLPPRIAVHGPLATAEPLPVPGTPDYRRDWGIGDRFVIQYSGNLGMGHDVFTMCQAMLAMKDDDRVRWVIVGDGVRRQELKDFVDRHGIGNVIMRPYEPRDRLGPLLSLADVHIVSMSPTFEGVILPSKFYGVLASGRPAIFIGPPRCEVSAVIDEEGCGVHVANGDHLGLIEAIARLREDEAECLAMGLRGRRALQEKYSTENCCKQWWELVRRAPRVSAAGSSWLAAERMASIQSLSRADRPDGSSGGLRILIISQYFSPDVTAAAYRISDTYKILRARGHRVRVITSTPHKGGLDTDAMGDIPRHEVLRVNVKALVSRSSAAYVAQFLGFVWNALLKSLALRRTFPYDVVWASSPPLLVALCTIPLRIIARRPVVLDIRDIWPESAVNIGKLRRGSLAESLGTVLEHQAYRRSDGLTCVSRPMQSYLRARTPVDVDVVYNGTPEGQLAVGDPGIQPVDRSVFCYAGNLGYAQGLDGVLRAFARLAHDASILPRPMLRLIGTGALERDLAELARTLGIADRVDFMGVRPKREALDLMSRSGILLIPLVDSPAFDLTVPSKVFDCMAIGRPIVASIRGEGREILESTGANLVVDPGDVDGLANAFVRVHQGWDGFMAASGRNVAVVRDRFSREAAVSVLERALSRAVSRTKENR